MVRLLLPNSPCSATNDQLSIPQWCDCCIGYGLWLWAMVLLSIPQWCDCCHLSNSPFVLNPKLSIPQWCDCCALMPTLWHQEHFAFNPTMVRLLRDALFALEHVSRLFQSHNGAIAAKAKFWGLRAKGKEMVKGLQSTFGCLKTLRGSTATGLSKLGYFGLKLPPHLYLAFKVLKMA